MTASGDSGDAPTEALVAAWEKVRTLSYDLTRYGRASVTLIARLTADNAALAEQVASLTGERDEARVTFRRMENAWRNAAGDIQFGPGRDARRRWVADAQARAKERDTAEATLASLRAAVERVRELHYDYPAPHDPAQPMCAADGVWWPCPTIAALDAALPAEPT